MNPLNKKKSGTVYLVGAGPGNVGLLTLRGKELLERADVVFYDHLVNPEILQFCPKAEQHYVGKVGHSDYVSQEKIEALLVEAAEKYSTVVRLKGGDPFIFGRGGEEAESLAKHGIPFEIVPGVTSAIAVPAYAGIPLTHRDVGSSVTFVTGHEDPTKTEKEGKALTLNWSALAGEKTLVFLMGVKSLEANFQKLVEQGMSENTPAAIVQWGTYPWQRTMEGTLKTLPCLAQSAEIEAPAIVVVGEVVKLRKNLNWFEKLPLFGKKILVTRSRSQASELRAGLMALGAQVVEFPTIEFQDPEDFFPLDQAIHHLEKYDWILFPSANAVEFFFRRLKALRMDGRSLAKAKLGAVGPGTSASLEGLGFRVDFQPEAFTGEALGTGLPDLEVRGKKILIPCAKEGREDLLDELKKRGAQVEVVIAYRNVLPLVEKEKLVEVFEKHPPDLLTFASSSSVSNLVRLLQPTPYLEKVRSIPCVVIGPVTRQTAEEEGFTVVGMPERYTIEDLVQEVLKYCKNPECGDLSPPPGRLRSS